MAKILSNSGIIDGSPVLAGHVTQSINALTGAEAYEITISGSLEVTGSSNLLGDKTINGDLTVTDQANIQTGLTASGLKYPTIDGISGSVLSTDSLGNLSFVSSLEHVTVATASHVITASYAFRSDTSTTASHATFAESVDSSSFAIYASTSSLAHTASYVDPNLLNFTASQFLGTGSGLFSGSFSGSFEGDGSGLTGVPSASYATTASYVSGLSINGIVTSASQAITASHVTNGGLGHFSGSFQGNGSELTNLSAPGNQGNILFNSSTNTINATTLINVSTSSNYVQIGVETEATAPLDVWGRIAQRGLRSSTALGEDAYGTDTAGCQNVAIGYHAISGSTSTECSIGIGYLALSTEANTNNNVAIGNEALRGNTGDNNTAIGSSALGQVASGNCNIGIGVSAMRTLGTGGENISIGNCSLQQIRSGSNNVAIGHNAGFNAGGAEQNVFVGNRAGVEILTGDQNVFIGHEAGECINGASLGNVVIGFCAGPNALGQYNNRLYINNEQSTTPLIYGEFGSDSTLNINGTLTASGLSYPAADATSGSILTTDGNGQLIFKSEVAFINASTVDTSSFYHSSSISASVITFNQATDTETITLPETSSYALMALTASYAISASHEISYDVSSSHAENADTASHAIIANTASSAIYAVTASHALNGGDDIPDGTISSSAQITAHGFLSESIDTSSFVTNSQTGSFVANSQTGSFVTNTNTASFVTNSQTGSFITNSQTSSFVNSANTISGSAQITALGFLSESIDTSSFVTNSSTASFVTDADTSSFFTGSSVSDGTITFQLGNATTESRTINNVTNALTASYIQAANIDGDVTSASYALTASYALNAGSSGVDSDITASSLVTASLSGSNNNFIEFTKGDDSTFVLQLDASVVNGNSYVHEQTVSSSVWNVAHDIGTSYPSIEVFNADNEVVLPQNIEVIDANNVRITFPVNVVGHAAITTGGGHPPINTSSFYISSSVNNDTITFTQGDGTTDTVSIIDATVDSSSFYVSSSVALNTITFTQGDGSTDVLTVDTGSGGGSNITIGNDGDNRVVTANGDGTISGSTDFTFDGTYAQAPTYRATTGYILRTPENLNGRRGFLFGDQTDTRRGGIDYHINDRTITLYANGDDGDATTISSRLEIDGNNEVARLISASLQVTGSTSISGSLSIQGIDNVSASIANLDATNNTGSLLVTASLSGSSLNVIEFEKGDGTTFDVAINSELPVTQSFTNTNTFDIIHSFNSKAVVVAVYDDNDEQVIPSNIAIVDNSTVRVTFSSNYTGYGVVTKGGITGGGNVNTFTRTFGPATSIVANHNFNQRLVLVQVYDEDFRQIIPQEITLTDDNNATIDFSSPKSGSIIIKK